MAFKLGIVRLGRAAGKMKYTLLDEGDISLVEDYAFEARLVVDKDGTGARVYAYAYNIRHRCIGGQLLHNLIWEKHCGGVAEGFKVIHKNNVTVDNRLENLMLVTEDYEPRECDGEPSNKFTREQSLYWIAVQQLHADPLHEHFPEPVCNKLVNSNGEYIDDVWLDMSSLYYECHYPPCTNMEKHIREFSICGRCQSVRYCGAFCQQKDWSVHKHYCRERSHSQTITELPER